MLSMLERLGGLQVPYLRRDAVTLEEFYHYLKKWCQGGLRRYPVLYLGFHGEQGKLIVGERRGEKGKVSLDELEKCLEGKAAGRVIHFGSCSTLDLHGKRLNRFLERTGAAALMGYRGDIQWVTSMAFELLLLGMLQDCSLTKSGMRKLERKVKTECGALARALKFRMKIHP